VWFENTTEHYHGDYSLPSLLPRIPRFYAEWFSICGPLLLLGLPLEGRRARLPMVLALAYSLLMCTADHVSPHYFVPLIALAAVSTAVNLARWTVWAPPLVREVIVAIVVAGMALWII
jgi:hypothetical protein